MVESDVKFDIKDELLAYLPDMRAFARFLVKYRERADDLVQDAAVRVLAAADQFQPGTNFKAWVFTILRNLYYNELQKSTRFVDHVGTGDSHEITSVLTRPRSRLSTSETFIRFFGNSMRTIAKS